MSTYLPVRQYSCESLHLCVDLSFACPFPHVLDLSIRCSCIRSWIAQTPFPYVTTFDGLEAILRTPSAGTQPYFEHFVAGM